MSPRRFAMLMVAALIALCGALYLSSRRNAPADVRGAALFPTLAAELNTVTQTSITKGAAAPAVTLHKTGERWTVAQRGDYPADVAKLRRLLEALGDARIIEEKTAEASNYPIIGVEDPTKAGATGAEVSVVAQDGGHEVIVGKPVGEGTFVRRAGESKSCTVEPSISVEAEPRAWIDTKLIDIPASTIDEVQIKTPGGTDYTLRRVKPKEGDFALDKVPAGRKALDAKALAPSESTLSGLGAEDVAAAKDLDFGQSSQAVFTLDNGDVVTLIGAAIGDKRWLEVHSAKDAGLDASTENRAFEVASYRYDAIFRPLDQLLVPKETKPADKPGAPGRKKAGASPARRSAPPAS